MWDAHHAKMIYKNYNIEDLIICLLDDNDSIFVFFENVSCNGDNAMFGIETNLIVSVVEYHHSLCVVKDQDVYLGEFLVDNHISNELDI